jgi:hypothetical protein
MLRFKNTAGMVAVAIILMGAQVAGAQKDSKEPAGKESAPDVPDAIAVPAGLDPVLYTHA